MKRLAIIILNWNCSKDSLKCANSVLDQLSNKDLILFIDNNSQKEAPTILEGFCKENPQIAKIIHNDENLGFAGGINSGLDFAIKNGFQYSALLNPDAIASKNWLAETVKSLDTDADIVTGKFLTIDGKKIDSTGEFYTTWGVPFSRDRDQPTQKALRHQTEIFAASGGCVAYNNAIFKDIGMFDEDYFMYFEDVDLCFRAILNGKKVIYNPKIVAYHERGTSSKKVAGLTTKQTFKNLPMLLLKNVPKKHFWHIGFRFLVAYKLFFTKALLDGRFKYAFSGLCQSLKLMPKNYKKRKKILNSNHYNTERYEDLVFYGVSKEQASLYKFVHFFKKK